MISIRQLNLLKENILDLFQDIDLYRQSNNVINKKDVLKLSALLEAFSVRSRESNLISFINESESYDRKYDAIVAEYRFNKSKTTALLEGFNNPFDTEDSVTADVVDYMKELDPMYDPDKKEVEIASVRLWNPDVHDKIYYKNGMMLAGRFFGPKDIIEKCPVRILADSDLYSKAIRDFAFSIDPHNRKFGVPFGYASYYRDSKLSKTAPNATYEYDDSDPKNPIIKIIATAKIPKRSEIVLQSSDDDYMNELNPDQFVYPKDDKEDDYVSTKNFKFL